MDAMMTSFRAAAGSGEDWLSACNECATALGETSPDVNLGIVYVGSGLAHALDLIVGRLRDITGVESWVGSGVRRVYARDQHEVGDHTISVLATALPPGGFQFFDGLLDADVSSAPGASEEPLTASLAIVHGDPRQTRLPSMVQRLAETSGAFLVGGLTFPAGSGGMQMAGQPTEGGLSGVMMSADIPIITGLTQGCTPIGPVRTITGIDECWITTLDGRPALDGLKEDVGPLLARSLDRMTGFILAARQESGHDQNDYLVRDLGEFDPLRGFIMVGDDLRRGDQLCFVKRDPEEAKADLRRLIADLKERAGERPVLGALYHSCIGRGQHLFGSDQGELAIIEDELGPVPLTGFQTNGEIFRDRLYGYSAVLSLFLGGAAS